MSFHVYGVMHVPAGVEAMVNTVAPDLPPGGLFDTAYVETTDRYPFTDLTDLKTRSADAIERLAVGFGTQALSIDGYQYVAPLALVNLVDGATEHVNSAAQGLLRGQKLADDISQSIDFMYAGLNYRNVHMASQLASKDSPDESTNDIVLIGAAHQKVAEILEEDGVRTGFVDAIPAYYQPIIARMRAYETVVGKEIDPKMFCVMWLLDTLLREEAFADPNKLVITDQAMLSVYREATQSRRLPRLRRSPTLTADSIAEILS